MCVLSLYYFPHHLPHIIFLLECRRTYGALFDLYVCDGYLHARWFHAYAPCAKRTFYYRNPTPSEGLHLVVLGSGHLVDPFAYHLVNLASCNQKSCRPPFS